MSKYPLKEAEDYFWWFCMANSEQKPTVMILGTSFANHLYAGIISTPALDKNSVVSIGACDPAQAEAPEDSIPVDGNPCAGYRLKHQKELVDKIIKESGTVKYAIIDGLRPQTDTQYIDSMNNYVERLESQGVKVIVFVPHVKAEFDIKGCFPRPLKKPSIACEISTTRLDEIHHGFQPLIDSVSKKHPSVKFFDQNKMYCDGKRCTLTLDGMPLFRDEYSHYSEYASNKLASIFAEWAKENAPEILTQ